MGLLVGCFLLLAFIAFMVGACYDELKAIHALLARRVESDPSSERATVSVGGAVTPSAPGASTRDLSPSE